MEGNKETDNLLMDPVCFGDLIGNGITLKINAGFESGITDEIYDELYGSDDEDDDKDDHAKRNSPWLGTFCELKPQMIKINDCIYKRTLEPGNIDKGLIPANSHVRVRYCSYWEGESVPFDSSVFSFKIGECNVLEGLEKAVCTMYEGERAQFVISFKLLFGEMGCPPRIKKRADGLYVIELISFNAEHIKDNSEISGEDRKKFSVVFKNAKDMHSQGLNFFKKGTYRQAADIFEIAANKLDFCQLANEDEEKEVTKFLIKLYTNLMVTYNKIKKPNKTCIVCRKIWQLTNNKPSCKVLFHKGRALIMLGDYTEAKKLLERAQRMEPQNIEIKNELEDLERRSKQLKESTESIRKIAFGAKDPNNLASNDENHLSEFKKNMFDILQDFKNRSDENFCLPSNLTKNEIDLVDELAKQLEMEMKFSESEKSYTILK